MGLAIFGLALLVALIALCWKKMAVAFVAVLAVMLGMTIANSGGFLAEPSQGFTNGALDAVDWLASSLFGGAR